MPRRRNENGLKRQQRIESEQQRRTPPETIVGADDRGPDPEPAAPVPPGVTQAFENLAPPAVTPRKKE